MARVDGFTKCPNWFFDEGYAAAVGPPAVAVYLCLRRHEDRDGLSYPGLNRISEKTGLSKPTVILALKVLNDCEVIQEDRQSVIPGKHSQTVVYRFDKPDQPVKALNQSNSLTGKGGETNRSMRRDKPVNALNGSYIYTRPLNQTLNQTHCVPQPAEPASFVQFWKAFPRNENRKKALEWWRRSKPSEELVQEIAAGLKRWKSSEQWKRGIVPHAVTWLNNARWNDEPMKATTTISSNGSHPKGNTLEEQYDIEAEAIKRLGI